MDLTSERPRPGSRRRVRVRRLDGDRGRDRDDWLAVEEPLEIRLRAGGSAPRRLAVTMRTPGADVDLVAGFLLAEGVIGRRRDLVRVRYCDDVERPEQRYNVVTAELRSDTLPPLDDLERYGTMSSACGVCGKTAIDAVRTRGLAAPVAPIQLDPVALRSMPDRLRAAQHVFDRTGGLHAAALFDPDGTLVAVREDVGRHNALDKLLGWALLDDGLDRVRRGVLLVSGRASYELVQKALAAGAPCLAAISAPSSLAVDLAEAHGMTLIGFLRGDRCNVYSGAGALETAAVR